jgi:hypothetical protein
VYPASFWLYNLWRMFKYFVDEHTRTKIHVIRSFNDILKYVDKEHIPTSMVRKHCLSSPSSSSFVLVCLLFVREEMMIINSLLMIILILLMKGMMGMMLTKKLKKKDHNLSLHRLLKRSMEQHIVKEKEKKKEKEKEKANLNYNNNR